MKVKLLKKIRKDWSIYKVTNIGIRPSKDDKDKLSMFEYPFYEVFSKRDDYGLRSNTFKTEQECKDYILHWVKKDWEHKMKPKVGKTKKEEKVWYVR